MPDISNQLNKATGDLATRFTDTTQITESFSAALDNAAKKLTTAFGEAEEAVKRKTRSDKGTKRGPRAKLEKEVEKQLGLRVKMEKLLVKGLQGLQKSVVGLSKVGIKGLVAGFNLLKKSLSSVASNIGGMFKKIPGIGKLAAGGPIAAITGVVGLLVKQLLQVSDTIAEISKDTGLVGNNLIKMKKNVIDATAGLHVYGISMKDVGKQASALVDSLGNANLVTTRLLDVTSRLAKATGMSAQESANLATNLIRGFGKTAPQVEQFSKSIMNFATNSGVNARKVMRDIANDSNLTAIYLSRGEDYMAKTAIMAAKMGKSMAENMATTDVFLDIEAGSDVVGKLNQFFGGNLNALKMYNLDIKQDTIGVMKELNKVVGTPEGISQLDRYPGIAKQLASQLNLNIKDFRNLNKVIKEMETAAKGPTKEQKDLNKFIYESMTLWEKIQGIVASMMLPMFTQLGSLVDEKLKPAMLALAKYAKSFAVQMNEAMGKHEKFGKKLEAAFQVLLPHLKFMFDTLGEILGGAVARGMWQAIKGSALGQIVMKVLGVAGGAWAGAKAGMAIGGGVGAGFMGIGAIPGVVVGGVGGALIGGGMGYAGADYLSSDATGNVHKRPTLALIGEEGRTEIVIPTERIRKGLPVDPRVAAELQSIGVPGYARGATIGLSSSALASASAAVDTRVRNQSLYASQGDPNAIKRREQKIEMQAAQDRTEQRRIVNNIMKTQAELIELEYYKGTPGGGRVGGGGGGGGDPMRDPKTGKPFGEQLHEWAKKADDFLKKHDVSYTDLFHTLPLAIQEPIEEQWDKLPEKMKVGLTEGVETAWDHYLKTGKVEEAIRKGAASGIREAYKDDTGRWAPAMAEAMATFVEGKSVEDSMKAGLRVAFKEPGGFIHTWIKDSQQEAKDFQKFAESNAGLRFDIREGQHKVSDLTEETNEYLLRANEAGKAGDEEAFGRYFKMAQLSADKLTDAEKHVKEMKDDQKDFAKMAAVGAAKSAGLGGALSSGMDTFLAGGSGKEVAKSALVGGASAAAQAGITAGLTGLGVPLPVAQMLGSVGGGLAGKGAGWIAGKLGLGPKKVDPAEARGKVLSQFNRAINKAMGPAPDDLYKMMRSGSGANDKLRNALQGINQKDQQALIGSLQNKLYEKTGVEFTSNEVATLLQAMSGKNIANFEQKRVLNAFEARMTTRRGAKGAIVSRPTVALIGESGPEALMPLENSPGSKPLGSAGGGNLADEIRQMNELLKSVITTPPVVYMDGQRVSKVIGTVQANDIRSGVYTVNPR